MAGKNQRKFRTLGQALCKFVSRGVRKFLSTFYEAKEVIKFVAERCFNEYLLLLSFYKMAFIIQNLGKIVMIKGPTNLHLP